MQPALGMALFGTRAAPSPFSISQACLFSAIWI